MPCLLLCKLFGALILLAGFAGCIKPKPELYQIPDSSRASTAAPDSAQNPVTSAATEKTPLEEDVRVRFTRGNLNVEVLIYDDEDGPALGRRILHRPENWKKLPAIPVAPHGSEYLGTPFTLLNAEYMRRVLRRAFPQDVENDSGWVHLVTYDGESLWSIAVIFTGRGENSGLLQNLNHLQEKNIIHLGQRLRIPGELLVEPLRKPATGTTPSQPVSGAPKTAGSKPLHSSVPELQIATRNGETYGVYRLKKGEALYSAVVVRFTGRVDAAEVTALARELMAINGIRDESAIPAGAKIKIPLRLIDESLLTDRPLTARTQPRRRPRHVILDAGHGGNDPGTIVRGEHEAEIAFDLMRRVQKSLTANGIKVHPLVAGSDGTAGMSNGHSRNGRYHQYVNVTPAYFMADSRVGLNLRIYLVDAIYRRLLREGAAPEEIMFISIHLDHLHPSVNGTMVYIPSAEERVSSYEVTEAVFRKYQESRGRSIRFTAEENRQAESASEAFAAALIEELRAADLPIHPYEPIRRYVYRGSRKWTPGIIRYSRAPTSVLIEAANLSNSGDFQRIRSSSFRQKLADTMVRAILTSR